MLQFVYFMLFFIMPNFWSVNPSKAIYIEDLGDREGEKTRGLVPNVLKRNKIEEERQEQSG